MDEIKTVKARLNVSGNLEYRDKEGNIIKTVAVNGSIPLDSEQVEQLKEIGNGDV